MERIDSKTFRELMEKLIRRCAIFIKKRAVVPLFCFGRIEEILICR
jgi:hypothetical protein